MGLRALVEKVAYIIGGSNEVQHTLQSSSPPAGVNYGRADAEASAKTQALIEKANKANEEFAAKKKQEVERKRLAQQALKDEEAASIPQVTHIQLQPEDKEMIIKNAERLSERAMNVWTKLLAMKNKDE